MSHRRSQVTRSSTNRSRGGRRQRMRSRSSGTKRTTTTTPHYEPHTHTCTHTNTRTQTHPDHQPFPDTAPPDCRPCSRSSVGAQPLTRRPQCLKRINQPESPAAATSAAVLTVSGLGCCRLSSSSNRERELSSRNGTFCHKAGKMTHVDATLFFITTVIGTRLATVALNPRCIPSMHACAGAACLAWQALPRRQLDTRLN